METSVGNIAVFKRALRAHRECRHGRIRAVVGHRASNRVAWSAIGAVGKSVVKPPATRSHDFFDTFPAGSKVCRNQRKLPGAGLTWQNLKITIAVELLTLVDQALADPGS